MRFIEKQKKNSVTAVAGLTLPSSSLDKKGFKE
jgi:hypothetical protein